METIKLAGISHFAEGRTRLCYIHLGDPARCIKVVKPGAIEKKKRKRNYRRLLPMSFFNPNLNEWRNYKRLERVELSEQQRHIPLCYGFVQTDMDPLALVTELIRNADGSIALPLTSGHIRNDTTAALGVYMQREANISSLKDAFAKLARFTLETGFYTATVHNIISARLDNGKEKFYLAECLYYRAAMRIIPFIRRRRMRYMISRLEADFERIISAHD